MSFSHTQEQIQNYVASAVLTTLRRLAGGGVSILVAAELRGGEDDLFGRDVGAVSSAAASSTCESNKNNNNSDNIDWEAYSGDTVKPTTNTKHPCMSIWLENLEKLAFSSVSFPNGPTETRGLSKKKKVDKNCNNNNDVMDGKPHDVEVRVALSLFHLVRRRELLMYGQEKGNVRQEKQYRKHQRNDIFMRKRLTANRDNDYRCLYNSHLGKFRKECYRQSRHLKSKYLSENKETQTKSNITYELISDLGIRREFDSAAALAKLISLELEEVLQDRDSVMYRTETISTHTNPDEFMAPKNDEDDHTTYNIPTSSSQFKSIQKSPMFYDVRPDTSGIICMTSQARSTWLRQAGKLPCPHCIKWYKGTKGLWWHQIAVHGMEYSMAAGLAAWEVNPLAIVPFGEETLSLVDATKLSDERADESGERKRYCPENMTGGEEEAEVFEFVKCGIFLEFVKRVQGGFEPNNTLDRNGASTLHWAAGCGHLEIASYLVLKCHCDPNQGQKGKRSFMGRTPLHWAARNGHLNVVKFLIDQCDANIDAVTSDGTTAFCWAAWQGHLAVMQFLHKRGCDIHTLNSFGCNAVLWSAQGAGSTESLSWLFQSGSDFSIINSNGHSALHKASQRGSSLICNFLVDNFLIANKNPSIGLSFICPDTEGSCPSDLCRMEGHDSLAQWISKQECDFILRYCKEEFSDMLDNERIPIWLHKELNQLQSHEVKFEVHSRKTKKGNTGLRQMALKLSETLNRAEKDNECFRKGNNNNINCID